jgi:chromosome segregation ATPase
MLTTKNLEKLIELEEKLRSEYQVQLDAKDAEIAAKSAQVEQQVQEKEDKLTIIAKQLEQITTLSAEATSNKRIEQLNRELNQRCDNLQQELASQKKRIKALQNDLAAERNELKALKQFDPARMKKNLDANKKKMAEKTKANDLLQKSLNQTKTEKADLQRQVKELEAKLEQLESEAPEAAVDAVEEAAA